MHRIVHNISYIYCIMYDLCLGANLVLEGSLLEIFGPEGEEISFGGWLAAIGPLCFLNLIVLWIVLVLYFILPNRSFRTFTLLRLSRSGDSNSNGDDNSHNHNDSISTSSTDNHLSETNSNSNSNSSKKDKGEKNVVTVKDTSVDLGFYDSNGSEFAEDDRINENESRNMIRTDDGVSVFEEKKEEESTEIDIENDKEHKQGDEKKEVKVNTEKERGGVEEVKEEEEGEEEKVEKEKKQEQSDDVYHPLQYPEWVVVSRSH